MSDKVVAIGAPPYPNGFQAFRFRSLMRAMRELPLDATEVEILARADSILYKRGMIYFDQAKGQWLRDANPPAKRDREDGEE